AFNRFHFAHSPTWRRQVWTQSLILPAIFLALLFLMWMGRHDGLEHFPGEEGDAADPFLYCLAAGAAVLSVIWIFFIRWYLNSSLARNTCKFLAEGSNRVMFGWREMELVNN